MGAKAQQTIVELQAAADAAYTAARLAVLLARTEHGQHQPAERIGADAIALVAGAWRVRHELQGRSRSKRIGPPKAVAGLAGQYGLQVHARHDVHSVVLGLVFPPSIHKTAFGSLFSLA